MKLGPLRRRADSRSTEHRDGFRAMRRYGRFRCRRRVSRFEGILGDDRAKSRFPDVFLDSPSKLDVVTRPGR
jgi:hypothetical protein